jgi:hypothetical protein
MKKTNRDSELDELIEEITTDANGEAEQLWGFRQAFEDEVAVPCEGNVIGEPVQVLKFDYDGNERRGLTAVCRRADGTKHVVAASEVVVLPGTQGGRYLAAYRKWMGIAPSPPSIRRATRRKTAVPVPAVAGPVELVVLSVKQKAAHCRLLGGDQTFTFRAGRLWDLVPGEIAVVKPAKQWIYAGNPYLSGVIASTRLDAKALGLVPLGLEQVGIWSPAEHYWGEEGDPIEDWASPMTARTLAISTAHTRSSWICAKPTSVAWMPTHTSGTSFSTTGPRMPSGITKWGSGSASYPSATVFRVCCRGGGSTIGHSSGACTDLDCAFGAWADSRKRPPFSIECCGLIQRTTRACGA